MNTTIQHNGRTLTCSPEIAAAFQDLQRKNDVLSDAGHQLLKESERISSLLFYAEPHQHKGNPHLNAMRDALLLAPTHRKPSDEDVRRGFEFWWNLMHGEFPMRERSGIYATAEVRGGWRAWRHLCSALGLNAIEWAELKRKAVAGAIDSARLDALQAWDGARLFKAEEGNDWCGEVGLDEDETVEAIGPSLRQVIDHLQSLTPAGAMARA